MKSKILKTVAIAGLALMPIFTLAQTTAYDPNAAGNVDKVVGQFGSIGSAYGWVVTLLGYLIGIFWVLAVAFLILAAIKYLTAQGKDEEVKKAKAMVKYGIIGIVVALLSTGIRAFVTSALSGQ